MITKISYNCQIVCVLDLAIVTSTHCDICICYRLMGESRFALITGPPGVGKTTLIKKLYELCKPAVGFYTEEVRGLSGLRQGFDIISLEDERSRKPLARESSTQRGPKVGKYTVQIPEFESVAIPCLDKAQSCHDEIIIMLSTRSSSTFPIDGPADGLHLVPV